MQRNNCVLIALILLASSVANAQGIYLSAAGPVNRSMGGAATAAPLEAIGATYWNPATTAGLSNELGFGMDILLPYASTTSSVVGLGSGTNDAEPGVSALPTIGWVHRASEDSNITYSLGLHPLAGFKTNYEASLTNPLFTPQANAPGAPGGLGRIHSSAMFLQIAPAVTVSMSDRLAIAVGPTLTLGEVFADPMIFGTVDDADGSGQPRYPRGVGTRMHWGGGAQLGVYYIGENCWHWGASIKSPQWMEDFRIRTQDETGAPRLVKHDADLPMIISIGAAYDGFENLMLAMDIRYFDYRSTAGLGEMGFGPGGEVIGIDQSSVFAMAVGLQWQMSDDTSLRMGYTYNQSPMQDSDATIAVFAPLFYQHQFSAGASRLIADNVALNFSFTHYFEADLTGPILSAAGPIPGSTVATSVSAYDVGIGATVKY